MLMFYDSILQIKMVAEGTRGRGQEYKGKDDRKEVNTVNSFEAIIFNKHYNNFNKRYNNFWV